MNVEPRWISINEVARMFGISRSAVNTYRQLDDFPKTIPLGRRVVFVKAEIEEFQRQLEASRHDA